MKTLHYFSILLLVSILGCQKSKPGSTLTAKSGDCFDIFPAGSGPTSTSNTSYDTVLFSCPQFDKTNSDLIYLAKMHPGGSELIRFNQATSQQLTLNSAFQFYYDKLKISGNSLIAKSSNPGYVSLFNSTGTVISNSFSSIYVQLFDWTPDNKLIYYLENQSGDNLLLLKDPVTMNIDTLMTNAQGISEFAVSAQNVLAIASGESIMMIDLNTPTPFNFSDFQPLVTTLVGYTSALCWSPDGNTLYTINKPANLDPELAGIFAIDISSGAYLRILRFCDSKRYLSISCSPDGQYLVGTKANISQIFVNGQPTDDRNESWRIGRFNLLSNTEVELDVQ